VGEADAKGVEVKEGDGVRVEDANRNVTGNVERISELMDTK